jgi:hypothetical protein
MYVHVRIVRTLSAPGSVSLRLVYQ